MTQFQGYGLSDDEEYTQQLNAWMKVARISGAILRKTRSYGKTVVELDPVKTRHLSDLEKLVLANQDRSQYGGEVSGNIVTVRTF